MKIRFGRKGRSTVYEQRQQRQLIDDIAENIYAQMGDDTAGLSQLRVEKLRDAIELEAVKENFAMFDQAVRIIMRSNSYALREVSPLMRSDTVTAFRGADLSSPGKSLPGMNTVSPVGAVNWIDLSRSWAMQKYHYRPSVANKFFIHRGTLLRELKSTSYRANRLARMGSVQVDAKGVGRLDRRRLAKGRPEFALAKLRILIFPNIPASLLPMLASHRWNDTTGGSFENYVFGGKTGVKLAGPVNKHRPLFQPLTQFWIAFRLPRAIQRAISRTVKVR